MRWGLLSELVLALAGLLLVGLALEGLLRGFDDFERNGPPLLHQVAPEPDVELTVGRPWYRHEFENRVRRNPEGFHGPRLDSDPERPLRVAVVGDSFVEAKQIPWEQNLALKAQERLPGVQLLPLGVSALYIPKQLAFFRDELPRLFGPDGPHPPLDAAVFCLRVHGTRHLASGHRRYPVPTWPTPWTYRGKQRVQSALVQAIRPAIRSRSHAVSYLSSRAQDCLSADLMGTLPPLDDERLDFAERTLRDEILRPMLELSARRSLPIGFLYLPTKEEYEGHPSPVDADVHRRVLGVLRELGAVYRDAGESLPPHQDLYWPYDRHPNAAGHAALALPLAELVQQLLGPR